MLALQPFTAEFGPAAEYFQFEYVEGLCAGEEGLKCEEFKLCALYYSETLSRPHGTPWPGEGRDRPVFALAVGDRLTRLGIDVILYTDWVHVVSLI